MTKTVLITGAAGFVGQYLVREFGQDHRVIALVRPGSQNLDRLNTISGDVTVLEHDIAQPWHTLPRAHVILHAGGDPSSENCIRDPLGAVTSNITATVHMLEHARQSATEHVIYYSTGEVFGPTAPGLDAHSDDAYRCTSPYAASKAAGAEMVRAYGACHSQRASVIHINNSFGERCQANRFPVLALRRILGGQELTVHQDAQGRIARRRWFHAADIASHTRFILQKQQQGFESWNSAGSRSIDNLEFADMIAAAVDRPLHYRLHQSERPGHTACYSITPQKLYDLGWQEPFDLAQRIEQMISWYLDNPLWLERT